MGQSDRFGGIPRLTGHALAKGERFGGWTLGQEVSKLGGSNLQLLGLMNSESASNWLFDDFLHSGEKPFTEKD